MKVKEELVMLCFKRTCQCPVKITVKVPPNEVCSSGVPICPECDEEYGYSHTSVKFPKIKQQPVVGIH